MTGLRLAMLGMTILALVAPPYGVAEEFGGGETASKPFALTLYGVVLSEDTMEDVLILNADFESDFKMAALALSRDIDENFDSIDLEWEVQLAKHVSGQHHWEVNGLLAGRWLAFPWDTTLDTSVAFGAGLSYATEVPQFERERHDEANDFLGYLLVELELRPPRAEHLSFVVRLHHRSGLFGTFDGVHGASNALGAGLKYRF
ncbi:hypothetical protein [Motiliproteus sp. SC1-56]|uniref:hypothetical protein n=1 Tax=Motiliproteus sp. SC1-56 TaxID=2799565 RepID=UPI001A8D9279|nr:hypothetical protein [Motiliproteus sp. SC1-56]